MLSGGVFELTRNGASPGLILPRALIATEAYFLARPTI
jgi:hypothetical protein